ncbi:hypothetical protein RMATCC62417_07567 [Rhizopus microsporus]|nr:hypothetical protein RMATCC62417_07567 [Rhizopus microsporus]
MIKNLGRFKQWTGEKFGGAKVTLQTEDFQRLQQETENRREGYEYIVAACEILYKYLLKKKPSPEDNKSKMMPFEVLGTCLYHYGTVFPEDSALGIALIHLGQTETRIAALQEALANELKTGRKLELKRLDYDSKLNRLHKAKKEKPELEQEMQAARMKYEETEHDIIQKMAYLQEFENEHRDALFNLIEAQCNFHNQAKELLEHIKHNWGQGSASDPREVMGKVMMARDNSPMTQNTIPKSEKYRKASFDFNGQNDDEISFKAGDLITVIDEIDKGWWVGEAHGKRGIFPVNYTEEYDVTPSSVSTHHSNSSNESLPPPSLQSRRSSNAKRPPPPPPITSTSSTHNNTHHQHSSSLTRLPSLHQASNSFPTPVTQTNSSPEIIKHASMPPPPPSVARNRSTAIRPPPPPPPIRSSTIDRSPHRVVLDQ